MTPSPRGTLSAQEHGQGLKVTKGRKRKNASTKGRQSSRAPSAAGMSASHWPATSSSTHSEGSAMRIFFACAPQAQMPSSVAMSAAARSHFQPACTRSQPKGSAAAYANVPGAIGMKPMPKQVANRVDHALMRRAIAYGGADKVSPVRIPTHLPLVGRSASLLRESAKASRAWRAVARGNSSPPSPYGLRRGSLARQRERRLVGGAVQTSRKIPMK